MVDCGYQTVTTHIMTSEPWLSVKEKRFDFPNIDYNGITTILYYYKRIE